MEPNIYGHTRIILGHFRYVCYSHYVWYTRARFCTLTIGSVLLCSEFWYIQCTLVHFTFGTLDGTLSVFWYTRIVIGHFPYVWYSLHVWQTSGVISSQRIASVFSTLGIIPREFWYILCTLVHLKLVHRLIHYISWYTKCFLAHQDHSWSFSVSLVQSSHLIHQLRFGTLTLGSVFTTLGIIPSELWYIRCALWYISRWYTGWYTSPVGTLSSFLAHQDRYWSFSLRLVTFVTPVVFDTLRIGSLFSTLGIILSAFWYTCCTLVHLTFGTPVGTLHQQVHSVAFIFWYTKIVIGHFQYVWYSLHVVWYTSCVW